MCRKWRRKKKGKVVPVEPETVSNLGPNDNLYNITSAPIFPVRSRLTRDKSTKEHDSNRLPCGESKDIKEETVARERQDGSNPV